MGTTEARTDPSTDLDNRSVARFLEFLTDIQELLVRLCKLHQVKHTASAGLGPRLWNLEGITCNKKTRAPTDQYKHGRAVPRNPQTQTASTARPGVQSTPDC